jgi:hypothetical protein
MCSKRLRPGEDLEGKNEKDYIKYFKTIILDHRSNKKGFSIPD